MGEVVGEVVVEIQAGIPPKSVGNVPKVKEDVGGMRARVVGDLFEQVVPEHGLARIPKDDGTNNLLLCEVSYVLQSGCVQLIATPTHLSICSIHLPIPVSLNLSHRIYLSSSVINRIYLCISLSTAYTLHVYVLVLLTGTHTHTHRWIGGLKEELR